MRSLRYLLMRGAFLLVVLTVIIWAYNNPHQAGTALGAAVDVVFKIIGAIWDKVVGTHHGISVKTH